MHDEVRERHRIRPDTGANLRLNYTGRRWHMNRFTKVDEVAEELGISKPYAYKIIRRLNDELKAKGIITIAGRVDRNYFNERYRYPGKRQNYENE